jgi:hypothetical protein
MDEDGRGISLAAVPDTETTAMRARRILAAAALLAAATGARAEAFFPGEESVFQLQVLEVPSGEARVLVGPPSGSIWPVIFQARTGGIAGIVDVREHLVSYWDAGRRESRGFDLRAYEVGDYHEDRGRFDRLNRKATLERNRKGKRSTTTFDVSENALDITAAMMWLRQQDLAPGDHREVPVWSGGKPFALHAEVLGREEIETPAGRFQTVKVQIRTAEAGKFSTKRDSFVWFSDDSRHVIVKMAADLALGRIVATLRSYRPGAEIAVR